MGQLLCTAFLCQCTACLQQLNRRVCTDFITVADSAPGQCFGTMGGLNVDSSNEVNRLYQKAIMLGGTSDGEPRVRSGMYSAYIRDLDKNKICLYKK